MRKRQNRNVPDFLGIGAQRSGSTWLYENLKFHPGIWLTPIKEVHFFDKRNLRYKDRTYQIHLRRRIFDYFVGLIRKRKEYLNLGWDLHYFLKQRNINWYKALFRPGPAQVAGEITPAYLALEKEIVQEIYNLNPELKIILIIRNPIDRAWSSTIKTLAHDRKKNANTISIETFQKKINSTVTVSRGNYLHSLSIWESVFNSKQLHIEFFDEIKKDASNVLLRIFEFLDVAVDSSFIPANAMNKINSSDVYKIPIPPEIELQLARTHLPQLKLLSERFGGHATNWLAQAQNIIKDHENS